MKIFLIGYRCTGKTTIGKILAHHLKFEFIDTDHLIEQNAVSSIQKIVKKTGWENFRRMEKKILFNTKNKKKMVISTGGGIIMDLENQEFIKKNGFSIWLDADINTILQRLKNDTKTRESRPALTNKDLLIETDELLKLRKPLYKHTAHIRIDVSYYTPEEIVKIILMKLDRRLS